MRTTIVTDSNCDLPFEYIAQNNVHVIPFTFQLSGISYTDDFGNKEFYNELRKGNMPQRLRLLHILLKMN